jgi:hypothetical protein
MKKFADYIILDQGISWEVSTTGKGKRMNLVNILKGQEKDQIIESEQPMSEIAEQYTQIEQSTTEAEALTTNIEENASSLKANETNLDNSSAID